MTGSLPTNGTPDDPGIAGSVTGEWVEVYPPEGEPREAEPPEPDDIDPEPASRIGPLATGLFGAALILVLLGSVLPLFRAVQQFRFGLADTLNVGAWRFTTANAVLIPSQRQAIRSLPTPVPLGYPLIIAGLLLVAAAALGMRASWRPSSLRATRLVGVVAATFLAGLVFALGMFEIAWRTLLAVADGNADNSLTAAPGQGFWLLVVAALAAIVAVVLVFRVRPAEPVEPPHHDWDDEEMEPAAEVPPGQPAEWPVVAVIPADERSDW
ncbi:MAG TPA: hypothetical protein VHV49_10220 [Pseudonocardiaceae bacterium]|nr:hypothetical protein [Pseudonocardiaceae bacterium]